MRRNKATSGTVPPASSLGLSNKDMPKHLRLQVKP